MQLKRLDFPYSKSESFFYGTKEDEILFLTWAFNPGTLYTLPSASRLVFEFADYTLSQNKRFQSTVGYVYGFEAMERLREEVTSLCRAGKPLPLAYVSQYSYHKHKMAQRIERLNECSYLSPAFRNMPEIIETLAQEFDQAVDTYAEKPSQNTAQAVELSMLAIEKMEKENYPGIWWSLKVVNHNLNCSESAIQKFFAKRKKV